MVRMAGWLRIAVAVAGLIAVSALVVGCSDDDSDAEGATATPTAIREAGETPGQGIGAGETPATGTGSTPPGPPSFPTEADPPGTTASANGESVEAGIGTYCWTLMCVDKIGVPTEGTLKVSTGDTVSVAIPDDAPALKSASAAVFEAVNPQPLDDGSEIWPYPGAPGDEVASETTDDAVEVTVDLAPGRYVLSVFMAFEAGDVMYGVLLEVE
jgi:hypothetical protein